MELWKSEKKKKKKKLDLTGWNDKKNKKKPGPDLGWKKKKSHYLDFSDFHNATDICWQSCFIFPEEHFPRFMFRFHLERVSIWKRNDGWCFNALGILHQLLCFFSPYIKSSQSRGIHLPCAHVSHHPRAQEAPQEPGFESPGFQQTTFLSFFQVWRFIYKHQSFF